MKIAEFTPMLDTLGQAFLPARELIGVPIFVPILLPIDKNAPQ